VTGAAAAPPWRPAAAAGAPARPAGAAAGAAPPARAVAGAAAGAAPPARAGAGAAAAGGFVVAVLDFSPQPTQSATARITALDRIRIMAPFRSKTSGEITTHV